MEQDEREMEILREREWDIRCGRCPECKEWDGEHDETCEHFDATDEG